MAAPEDRIEVGSLFDAMQAAGDLDRIRMEVATMEEAVQAVRDYEIRTTTKYYTRGRKLPNFGCTPCDLSKHHKVLWEETHGKGHFAGKPFIVANYLVLECTHGPDRNVKMKEKMRFKRHSSKAPEEIRTRTPVQTKKVGCPATVLLKEVVYFNDYKIPSNSRYLRETMSKKLRADLKANLKLRQERQIIVHFPATADHQNHVIGESAGSLQNIDDRLKVKIAEYVADLVTDVAEIRKRLEQYVKHVLFRDRTLPERTNRRFFPTDHDIKNHIALSVKKLQNFHIDQKQVEDVLRLQIENHPENLVYFRPSTQVVESATDLLRPELQQTLLIIFQTSDQKRLLSKYGNDTCLLDGTYKTTVPLYFVCVKTNVDYQTVAMFIVEGEQTEYISESLQVLRDANPSWNPTYFITDFNDCEVNAIESVFSGCHVYLCDYHREQVWHQWLSTSTNDVSDQKEEVLARLRRLADAQSEEALLIAYEDLQKSDVWKANEKLRSWFLSDWYGQVQRWALAYRKDTFIFGIHTNNGVEGQNELLKQQYLKQRRNNTLSSLLITMIEQFFPELYKKYQTENVKLLSDYKLYAKDTPHFLRDRPRSFVLHCMQRMQDAQTYKLNQIEEVGNKVFRVKSETQPESSYMVVLGTEAQFPSCECSDWLQTKLLCKHFFAVFANTKHTWDDVSELYRSSKYFSLDEELMDSKGDLSDGNSTESGDVSPYEQPAPPLKEESVKSRVRLTKTKGNRLVTALPRKNIKATASNNEKAVFKAASASRKMLVDLMNMTFDIADESTVLELNSKLGEMKRWMRDVAVTQETVPWKKHYETRRTRAAIAKRRLTKVNVVKGNKRLKRDESSAAEMDSSCPIAPVLIAENGEVIGEVIAEVIVDDTYTPSDETTNVIPQPLPKDATTTWVNIVPCPSQNKLGNKEVAKIRIVAKTINEAKPKSPIENGSKSPDENVPKESSASVPTIPAESKPQV